MLSKRLLALVCASCMYMAVPAGAADKGGLKDSAGMADLEERVAELENVVARKGGRKLTVVITGQVNKAYFLGDNNFGSRQRGVIDNSSSPTVLGVEGSVKFGEKNAWTAGYRIELGVDSSPPIPFLENQISVRHNFAFVDSPIGKLSIGHTSMATDKIVNISLANVDAAARMLSLAPVSTVFLLGFDLPFADLRRDLVRYDSPIFGGLIISASLANGDGPLDSIINSGFSTQTAWDIAARWAGETKELGGVRAAVGIGYRDENFVVNSSPISLIPFVRDKVYSGSASVMSLSTGLFANVAVARVDGELLFGSVNYDAYHIQAGIERKFFPIGKTTLFAEWAQLNIDGTSAKPNLMGVGVVQNVEAAAMDLYVTYRRLDADNGSPELSYGMAGVRLRF